jgi:PTS system mannose-specific IID component
VNRVASAEAAPRAAVRATTLARAFWRGLFLQAGWNRRGMQNLGFAYAILPALEDLYAGAAERRAALERHLGFFNCHPYMAAAILGGAIHHEERVARGEAPAGAPQAYKQTLQGPLAAIGDGFFWTALRPFFGALAAAGALAFGWPAVVAALTIYNVVHLSLRIGMFRAGYREGDAVVGAIARLSLPVLANRLRLAAAGVCGLCAALVALVAARTAGPVPGVVAAVVAVAGYAALARGARLLPAAYGALAAGTATALAAGRLAGGP